MDPNAHLTSNLLSLGKRLDAALDPNTPWSSMANDTQADLETLGYSQEKWDNELSSDDKAAIVKMSPGIAAAGEEGRHFTDKEVNESSDEAAADELLQDNEQFRMDTKDAPKDFTPNTSEWTFYRGTEGVVLKEEGDAPGDAFFMDERGNAIGWEQGRPEHAVPRWREPVDTTTMEEIQWDELSDEAQHTVWFYSHGVSVTMGDLRKAQLELTGEELEPYRPEGTPAPNKATPYKDAPKLLQREGLYPDAKPLKVKQY